MSGVTAAGLVAALVALSSCSGGSASPGVTVVAAGTSTTFRTEPVRTTTTTVAPPPDDGDSDSGNGGGDAGDGSLGDQPDAESTGEQTYEVRRGDYLVGIANRFDVTAEDIAAYNGWESVQHALQPGDTIRIPPEDWDPDEATAGSGPDDVTSVGDSVAGEADSDGTCPDGSEQQTYTIRAGDVKGTVARRFDVTVAELDAANAGTQYYDGFVIGVEILIPC